MTSPEHREPPPPMLVGDAMPAPGQLVPEQAQPAAAMLPDGLQVGIEGTSTDRAVVLAVGLLVLALLGLAVAHSTFPYPTTAERLASLAAIAGACGAAGAVAYRTFIRHRKEYRLDEDGIVLEVWHRGESRPWVTHVPWAEIADYTVSVTPDAAMLRVASVRGYTLTLRDRPARLSTRELIRRFIEQAERHPRAVRPPPGMTEESWFVLGPLVGEQDTSLRGFLIYAGAAVLLIVGIPMLRLFLRVPTVPDGTRNIVLAGVMLVTIGWSLWMVLEDPDRARADGHSRRPVARLRRWLRKVLGIRVT